MYEQLADKPQTWAEKFGVFEVEQMFATLVAGGLSDAVAIFHAR
jgi:hypothetical protein